jgi:hypothetical protein
MLARLWMATLLAGASLGAALLLAGGAQGTPRARAAATAAQCSRTQQLAYVAAKYPGEKGMVWFAAANGKGRRRLFRAATPELSPDGSMVAVTEFGHSAGLGIFTACGGRVGQYFSAHDAIGGIVWSPDSSLVAAVVDPNPNGSPFGQRLEIIDVATGHVSTVATGFLDGSGGPSFSPTSPYQLAYAIVPRTNTNPNVWSAAIGQPGVQLTHGGYNDFPLWGPQGILYEHSLSSGAPELELISGGRSTKLMRLNGWPVAVSSDGVHLAAEGAACGVVWPLSVNLATRKVVHQFGNGFAPFGISASGGALLIAGSPPSGECGGKRSVIETVPFGGGRPTKIAYGTSPSWADSAAVSVQDYRSGR